MANLKDMSVEEKKKLLEMLNPKEEDAKSPTDLIEPQNPENYTDNDADSDETEFKDADADQSDRAITDEADPSSEEDQAVASAPDADKVSQGDAKPGIRPDGESEDDEEMPLNDEESIADELGDSGKTMAQAQPIDKDGNPVPAPERNVASEAPATELTPEEQAIANAPAAQVAAKAPPTAPPVQNSADYYSDLMKRFKAAQDQSNLNRNLNDIGKYAYAGGTSFRGVQANPLITSAMEEEGKRADLPVQQFLQQLQVEGQDPNSPAAQSMRTALASTLGIDPSKLGNLNGDQMDKISKSMGTIVNNKVKTAATALNAQTNVQKAGIQQQVANTKAQQAQNQLPLIGARTDAANAQAKYLGLKPDLERARIAAAKDKATSQASDKQQASDEKEIAKAQKEMNGLSASSRSVIGSAERIKAGGQRMATILDDPNATPQDMQSAAADMNAMISGNATVSGTDHSSYNNLETDYSKAIQYLTSSPNAPDVPQVKQHMKDVAKKIMDLSDKIQEKQMNRVFAGRKAVFDRNPSARQDLIDSLKDAPAADATAPGAAYDGSSILPQGFTPEQKALRLKYLQNKAGQ